MAVQPLAPIMLSCHTETPAGAVSGIKAFTRFEGRDLAITYVVHGDIGRLRVPPPKPPRWTPDLWQHTCFEAFIATGAGPGYNEFNFSPSGEWAAYRFRGYRDGAALEAGRLEPGISVRRQRNSLELNASLRLDQLSGFTRRARARLGLSAVIEDCEGRLSYWALRHPSGKPDFHCADNFILQFTR
jgi:hypothetical protein